MRPSFVALCFAAQPLLSQQRAVIAPGLWRGQMVVPPSVVGTITVTEEVRSWVLRIAGERRMLPTVTDSSIVDLGARGQLRLFRDGAATITGYFVQPPGERPAYATPIQLRRRGKTWNGRVAPLPNVVTLYLRVDTLPDGRRRANFLNPEMNWRGGRPWFELEVEGNVLLFREPTSKAIRFRQSYDSAKQTISFDFGAPLVLSPLNAQLNPRSFGSQAGRGSPSAQGDGWPVANPSQVGIVRDSLAALVKRYVAVDAFDDTSPRVHSLLIARHGKLVHESYFFGESAESLHDLRSASKSFTSLMSGIAFAQARQFGIEERAAPLLFPSINGLADVRLGDLLSHTSGLACNDGDDNSPGNEDTMQSQHAQPDWFRFTLELPVSSRPGTYAYCSAGINLVGGMVARRARTWLPRFFDQVLAGPLGIDRFAMNLMPTGEGYSGGGLYLRSRDFLKFGQLVLDRGRWHGKQVVPKEWVAVSTAHHADAPDGSRDGFGWHLHRVRVGSDTLEIVEANGNGGQFLIVVPARDMVIVFTAGSYGQYPIWRKLREEWLPQILAAVRD